jgi:hypothetical protein
MIHETTSLSALAMQTSRMAIVLWFAWAFTLGPAICLLRGRNAGDLMFKVTLYIYAVALGTRLCNIWYIVLCQGGEPIGYLLQHGYDGFLVRLDRPVLLTIWICGGLAGHALIYSASMLRRFWTTARNRAAVVFYSCALLVGFLHPLPIIHFWGNWNRMVLTDAEPQREANRELTDSRTHQWVHEYPDDYLTLLMRANYLANTQRHSEALPLYRRALQNLPQERQSCRAGIEKMMEETNNNLDHIPEVQ